MSDEPTPSSPPKSGHAVNAGPPPKEAGQSASPIGTRSFGDPPDSGGSPPKSGAVVTNSPEEQVAEQ